MAPTRTVKSKSFSKDGKSPKASAKSSTLGARTKSRISKKPKTPPPKQQKTKSAIPARKKKHEYTEKELGVQSLNTITPVGVQLPKGKKKGKVFVDDQESMMTILAIVNAEKEGQIESKMMRSRQLEEIREARLKEAEARQAQRQSKLEETKSSMRKKRKKRQSNIGVDTTPLENSSKSSTNAKDIRKRVSFA